MKERQRSPGGLWVIYCVVVIYSIVLILLVIMVGGILFFWRSQLLFSREALFALGFLSITVRFVISSLGSYVRFVYQIWAIDRYRIPLEKVGELAKVGVDSSSKEEGLMRALLDMLAVHWGKNNKSTP